MFWNHSFYQSFNNVMTAQCHRQYGWRSFESTSDTQYNVQISWCGSGWAVCTLVSVNTIYILINNTPKLYWQNSTPKSYWQNRTETSRSLLMLNCTNLTRWIFLIVIFTMLYAMTCQPLPLIVSFYNQYNFGQVIFEMTHLLWHVKTVSSSKNNLTII